MNKKRLLIGVPVVAALCVGGSLVWHSSVIAPCLRLAQGGCGPRATPRIERFRGKVQAATAACGGGDHALAFRATPWVDWSNYWATGDSTTKSTWFIPLPKHVSRNSRGEDGGLLDLEYARIELIKFNLFDNSTFQHYVNGRSDTAGRVLKVWDEMRLPRDHPHYQDVGGTGAQLCRGDLIRFRTLTGICNDIRNPAMGSTNQLLARNVQFEATFPDLSEQQIARNRHGDRLGLLKPDPQVISRKLFTRAATADVSCNDGHGLPDYSPRANCDYKKAPFFNVLAAFWIQFMTHDWFSHLQEGHNRPEQAAWGCSSQDGARVGCRPGDRMEPAYFADQGRPPTFTQGGREYLARAYKTTRNTVTAWWDASQIYGYDSISLRRVKRDPTDPAKLLMVRRAGRSGGGEQYGYLPVFQAGDPINPAWAGQEATAFPDNWTVGLSFFHNLFVREHNIFVEKFRERAALLPDDDSGLRNPNDPDHIIRYRDVTLKDLWDLRNPDHVNGGVNHFGSPFNFPEEFVTVYRLHPLVPDLLEYREWDKDPNVIRKKIPVVDTFRGKATPFMADGGLANWALSMGRQRLGLLALQNHPRFLQNLALPHLRSATNQLDIAALDLIRDRERGVPRFNEFRRQDGLKQLTGLVAFVDQRLPSDPPAPACQVRLAALLREVYGQHRCDAGKIITEAQLNDDGSRINDCLGHPDGALVDNIEDLDTVVGFLAETTRPHGFAISETQLQVFNLNASRRLFSDRFFASRFRPEFHSRL